MRRPPRRLCKKNMKFTLDWATTNHLKHSHTIYGDIQSLLKAIERRSPVITPQRSIGPDNPLVGTRAQRNSRQRTRKQQSQYSRYNYERPP